MYLIRMKFTSEIPLLFERVSGMLTWEYEKMELARIY